MKTMLVALVAAGVMGMFVLAAQPARAAGIPIKAADSEQGQALVDANGEVLFVFDQDTPTQSSCTDDRCQADFEPVLAGKDAQPEGEFTTIARPNGQKQWAHKGRPLYYAMGADPKGTLPNGWSVARP